MFKYSKDLKFHITQVSRTADRFSACAKVFDYNRSMMLYVERGLDPGEWIL